MSKESKQILFEQIGAETAKGGNTKSRIRNAFTSLNNEKIEVDGSNLSGNDIQSLQSILGINQFSSSRFLEIGEISVEDFVFKIGVPESGFNKWLIKNNPYQKLTETELSIDEIEDEENFRIDSIYANTANTFEVIKGVESENPTKPIVTDTDLLFLTDILITPEGINIDTPIDLSGYKEKSEDNWKEVLIRPDSTVFIPNYSDSRTCFSLKTTSPNSIKRFLDGITFSQETNRAIEFIFKNNTVSEIDIRSIEGSGLIKRFALQNTPDTIPPFGSAIIKYNPETDLLEIIKLGSTVDLSGYIPTTEKGAVNGVATLDGSGQVPSSQLPSYVDDILDGFYVDSTTFTNELSIPYTPEKGKIYTDVLTGINYRWSGTVYTPSTDLSAYATKTELSTGLADKQDISDRVTSWSGTVSNSKYPSEKLVKDSLDNKIDKVYGVVGKKYAVINTDGSLSAAAPTSGNLAKVIGQDALGEPKVAETKELSAIYLGNTPLTTSELNAFGTKNVEAPLLNRVYTIVGAEWKIIEVQDIE